MPITTSNFPELHDVVAFATQYNEFVGAVSTATLLVAVLVVKFPAFRRLVALNGVTDIAGYAATGVVTIALLGVYDPVAAIVPSGLVLGPVTFLASVFLIGTLTYTAPYLLRVRRAITHVSTRLRHRIRAFRSPNELY